MKPPTAKLTLDDAGRVRSLAEARGDAGPKLALAEMGAAVALHRTWEGGFKGVSRWDTWKRVGLRIDRVLVVVTTSLGASLELPAEAAPEDAIVLVQDRGQGSFAVLGWIPDVEARAEAYRQPDGSVVVPSDKLRSPWELRKKRRGGGRRLHPSDPADDFAGESAMPAQLDTDPGVDELPPRKVGRCVVAKLPPQVRLPCRRCRKFIGLEQLSTWSMRTGSIHGDPADCKR